MSRAAKLFGLVSNNNNSKSSDDDDDLEGDDRHQRAFSSPEKLNRYLKSLFHNNASTERTRNANLENKKTTEIEHLAAGNKTPECIDLKTSAVITQQMENSDDNLLEFINLEPCRAIDIENENTTGIEHLAAENKTPECIDLKTSAVIPQQMENSDDNFPEFISLEPSSTPIINNELVVIETQSDLDNFSNETMIIDDFLLDPINCNVIEVVEINEVGTALPTEDTNVERSFREESPYPDEDLIRDQECNNSENYPFEVPRKRNRTTDSSNVEGNDGGTGRERSLRGNKRFVKGDTRISRLERKERRNKGQSYTTKSGKDVLARHSLPLKMCRLKCKDKVSHEMQKSLFDDYWNLGASSKRAGFIASLIEISQPVQSRPRSDNPRNFRQITVNYHLVINGRNVRLCKKCFCKCFGESNKFLESVIAKKRATQSGIIQEDMRGRNIPSNKTSEKQLKEARDHLLSLPSYESHYTRKDSSKRYLPPYYTISQCYEEYKNQCSENIVSEKIYRQLFHELKLSIKIPNKDTCQTCDKFHMDKKVCKSVQEREIIEKKLDAHHDSAEYAYKSKAFDRDQSKNDVSKKTITFDLQQCLPTPMLQSSLCFYKRQLWVFNLTVHDCDNGQGYCYMWDETTAARGGNDIASCIYKYLIQLPTTVTHITMYSDTCGGQNKNIYFAIMCMVALQNSNTLKTIDHKFLIPGHTRMESDSDHSLIEKMKKKSKVPIEHPHDWIQLVRLAAKKKPFIVNEMERKDFYCFADILKNQLQNRKIDINKSKVNWRQIKWLRFSRDEIGSFQFKNSLEQEEIFKKVDLRRRGRSQNIQLPLKEKYSSQLPITAEKKKDLLDLLPFISETFREFYKNIPTSSSARNALYIDSGDEEVED